MKKIITLLLCIGAFSLQAQSQEESPFDGEYHIFNPSKNPNTGKLQKTIYLQIADRKHVGIVAQLSVIKGLLGISYKLQTKLSEQKNKLIFLNSRGFLIEYNSNAFVMFNLVNVQNGEPVISHANFLAKNKEQLAKMTNAGIEKYVKTLLKE